MDELAWWIVLYGHLVMARIRAQLQYRLSFALDFVGVFFITFIDFLAIVILFAHLPRLAGWSFAEVAFFYGIAGLSFAVTDLTVGHLDFFPRMVRDGTFDLILIRPAGSLFQVITADFALRRLGKAAQSVAVLIYALVHLSVHWTPGRVAMLLSMVGTGSIIFACIWIVFSISAFWATDAREVTNAFTYGGNFLASYPINIFSGWLRRLLAFVIPTAFVAYFPGLYVLGRVDPLGTPSYLPFCTPLVALALLFVARGAWRFGVRHYRSTGS